MSSVSQWIPPTRSTTSAYFSEAYGRASAPENGRWIGLADAAGTWQLPVVLVPIVGSHGFEAKSPYGYAGIAADGSLSDTELCERWRDAIELLRAFGVVSLFLRFAPFDLRSVERSRALPGLELRHTSDTVLVSTKAEDLAWASLRGRARTAIRKAISLGLSAQMQVATVKHVQPGSNFRILYEETMSRVQASSRYYFTDGYYESLASGLRDRLWVCSVADNCGEVVAASLVIEDSDVVHYHLSGSTPDGARRGANNLLIWEILKTSAAMGKASVHLGGGVAPDDSLFQFKKSFGGEIVPFYTGRSVIDPEEYERLVKLEAHRLNSTPQALERSLFFPAFRSTGVTV